MREINYFHGKISIVYSLKDVLHLIYVLLTVNHCIIFFK